MSPTEKMHIIDAFSFELGKVKSESVKQQVMDMFANVSLELATAFAVKIGANPPKGGGSTITKSSPALSQENTTKSEKTRKVAVILTKGFNGPEVKYVLDRLKNEGLMPEIISENIGTVQGTNGIKVKAEHTFLTAKSVLFDAVYMIRGSNKDIMFNKDAAYFIDEAFSHYKPIGATGVGIEWLKVNHFEGKPGVISETDITDFVTEFVEAIAAHRFWQRKLV
jgi:catalase